MLLPRPCVVFKRGVVRLYGRYHTTLYKYSFPFLSESSSSMLRVLRRTNTLFGQRSRLLESEAARLLIPLPWSFHGKYHAFGLRSFFCAGQSARGLGLHSSFGAQCNDASQGISTISPVHNLVALICACRLVARIFVPPFGQALQRAACLYARSQWCHTHGVGDANIKSSRCCLPPGFCSGLRHHVRVTTAPSGHSHYGWTIDISTVHKSNQFMESRQRCWK